MTRTVEPARPYRPGLPDLLRLTVTLAAMLFFAVPLTSASGIAGVVIGTLAGTALALRLARTRLRSWLLIASGILMMLLGLAVAHAITHPPAVASLVGSSKAILLGELFRWLLGCLGLVGLLRVASLRRPLLAFVEASLAATSIALALSAHRDGSFHRPLQLGDWAWSRGIDPAEVLVVLGAATALALVPVLLRESLGRFWRHLMGAALLLALLLAVLRFVGPPRLPHHPEENPQGQGRDRTPASAEQKNAGPGSGSGTASGRNRTSGSASGTGQSDPGKGRSPSVMDMEFPFPAEPPDSPGEAAVAIVVLHDDLRPTHGNYYFRQVAFSQFNGVRLVRSTRDDADTDLFPAFPVRTEEVAVPDGTSWLPSADPSPRFRQVRSSVGLLADHPQPFGLIAPLSLQPLHNPNPRRFVRVYRVDSWVDEASWEQMLLAPPGESSWSSELHAHYTELPDDPRYRKLAEEAIALLSGPLRDLPLPRALAIKHWLDQHVIYSHRIEHAPAADAVAPFLFGDRKGTCIHNAHSAVYLLRALGVPARVGAGYAVDATHRSGGSSILIRGGNAHAWPEIYLSGHGWVVVDITPEQSEEPPLSPPDPVLQRMLGEMARSDPTGGSNRPEPPGRDTTGWDLSFLLRAAALLAGSVLALLYLVKIWRRFRPLLPPGRESIGLAYRAAVDRLAELGCHRQAGEARPAFARRVQSLAPSFGSLTELWEATCLGWPHRPPPTSGLPALLASQKTELHRAFPLWRRVLGLVDPFSWMRSRSW